MTDNPASPIRSIPTDTGAGPRPGVALCLSGGGYRAMLFHLGALWRLNETAWLPKLIRVSSVSGGSIAAGVLGHRWSRLAFVDGVATGFEREIVAAIRRMAGHTIDVGDVLKGLLTPGTIGEKVAASYDALLFRQATLQDLPDVPRFVINATNVQSGVLWRFSKPYMWDWRVGKVPNPAVRLAVAVGASSAFPPVLSPARLKLDPADFEPDTGVDLQKAPFTEEIYLTDGGVYDNLGLETAWKEYDTILVSDGGGQMAPDPEPHTDWARHALRINALIDNQVRSLRKRQVVGSYVRGERRGDVLGHSQRHRILSGGGNAAVSGCRHHGARGVPHAARRGARRSRRSGSSTGAMPCATPPSARTWMPDSHRPRHFPIPRPASGSVPDTLSTTKDQGHQRQDSTQ